MNEINQTDLTFKNHKTVSAAINARYLPLKAVSVNGRFVSGYSRSNCRTTRYKFK